MEMLKELEENINYYPNGTIITYEKDSPDYREEYFFKTVITTINGVKQQVNVNDLQDIIPFRTIRSFVDEDNHTSSFGFIIVDYPLNSNQVINNETIDNGDCELSFKVLKEIGKVFLENNPQYKNIDINKQIEKNKKTYWNTHTEILKNILLLDDNYNGIIHPEKYNALINSVNDTKPVINIIDNSDHDNTISIVIETTIRNNIKIPLFSYQVNIEELDSYGIEEIVNRFNIHHGDMITVSTKQIVLNDMLPNDMLNTRDSIYVSIFNNYFKDIIVNDFNPNYIKEKYIASLMKLNIKDNKLPEFNNNVLNIKYLKLNC